jgi:predicted metal-dependent phosphoesterase TrpH/energy-coupling factor transporter ATP-binding protein EcfA2
MTHWWKCDLQVASPNARDFRGPVDEPWSLGTDDARADAASRYMRCLKDNGVEVAALADHNDASWVKIMKEAGEREGVVVFPGMEVTTGTGADGVHLILIGGRDKEVADFEEILAGVCGFGVDHPRFDPVSGNPASSPKTLLQILSELPDGYLAIAPHIFTDNGIASARTARGDIRWKALHHERLTAVDVGDVSNIENLESWRAQFIRRELSDFPCLPGLPFVSTSDAYSLEDLGRRFTWIRMAEPTLEALRQAFLDHEVRVICDWNESHPATSAPNEVAHAWVDAVELHGISTSAAPITLRLDPRLNVLIGGRGSGKSTIVAALRLLYGDVERLPDQAKAEFDEMRRAVFSEAQLNAVHRLAHSNEAQTASWSVADGSTTARSGDAEYAPTTTDFKVRVINQKELFERAAHSADDPTRASRNLLTLVDDSLAIGSASPGGPAAFATTLEEVQTSWIGAARAHQSESEATAQRDVVAARVVELSRQVEAFDAPESRSRRTRNDVRAGQYAWWGGKQHDTNRTLGTLTVSSAEDLVPLPLDGVPSVDPPELADSEFAQLQEQFNEIRRVAAEEIGQICLEAASKLTRLAEAARNGTWGAAAASAMTDQQQYVQELAALGVDPAEYDRVRRRLEDETDAVDELDRRRAALPALLEAAEADWAAMTDLLDRRRSDRRTLLDAVSARSSDVRFTLEASSDSTQWSDRVRDLLNLRADGFLQDVPALGAWLWNEAEGDERAARLRQWRDACVTGEFSGLARSSAMRAPWQQRLEGLDSVVRARLGSEIAEDVVSMEFLREGGDPDQADDWRPLTTGSPGQRSASMLSFVLHQGVEPLVLDQPEDDLDTEWITDLVVKQLRSSRWTRQIIVVTHNANIPVNADAERIIVMEGHEDGIRVRSTECTGGSELVHVGALEDAHVRQDIQRIMEGGVPAFVRRERRYNNELDTYRAALRALETG